ncbi:hypothetical protein [Enterobacter hormaechei]|uniref:hypothetical protein n=1 Tax=Enterobacter hormaechei TaxID=158836 RepID=UPI0012B5E0D2|nr:hypothetical protein [Enterobacter hormaechei]MCR4246034.1 hypothetical protein [Enterobacter hormaechei]MDR9987213.1 hypothetical protein [Enterobacter hormaechei subsp. steigerwaltii]MDZ5679224.1 hypothetical protein [Enterobacter hormaechei]WLP11694.1 hypothetical protein Q8Z25_02920 [Enterobacter hormaechei]HCD9772183.1 hypothetical protein [Enterobacter hormaechei]
MKRIFITASVLLAPLNNAYAGCSAASFAACSSLATSTGSRPRPSHWPGGAITLFEPGGQPQCTSAPMNGYGYAVKTYTQLIGSLTRPQGIFK